MSHSSTIPEGNLFIPSGEVIDNGFERAYCMLRSKEKRMYTDEELIRLPEIDPGHPHSGEWKIRKESSKKLIRRLESKNRNLQILEIGCGNGWLAHLMSRIPGTRVVGVDINLTELQQAARVFGRNSKLKFFYGNFQKSVLSELKFDVVVFAASVQYFPSVAGLIELLLQQVYPGGEINILDSIFYEPAKLDGARKRSSDYFDSMGFPEMSDYYFHHSLSDLISFSYEILRDPRTPGNRFFGKNPFYWICIKKDQNR